MTRLITEWIEDIGNDEDSYGVQLKAKTGMNYDELLMRTCNQTKAYLDKAKRKVKVCVIPITTGEGIIGSFSQSVAAIIKNMGFSTTVTEATDVAGIYEASMKGAEVVFMADDNRYIALNLKDGKVSNNDEATARGFITILNTMTKDIDNPDVLVLGAGTVGKLIINMLYLQDNKVFAYDRDTGKLDGLGTKVVPVKKGEIKNFQRVIDATCEGGWITKDMLHSGVKIAALGVPFSLDEEAAAKFEQQSIYDCLVTGTAIMLGEVI